MNSGNRISIILTVFIFGLSAYADYSFTTTQPLYPNPMVQPQTYGGIQPYQQYPQYQQLNPAQPIDYTTTQSYAQPYNHYYQNPYQNQCQGQYINPYQYPRPYGYGNNLPATVVNSAVSGMGNTGGASSIAKNIIQSMIYAKMRGY